MKARLLSILLAALPLWADGRIRVDLFETARTDTFLLDGREQVESRVRMTYLNWLGNVVQTEWRAQLWIEEVFSPGVLINSGWTSFESDRYADSVNAFGNFSVCRGKSVAIVGSLTQEVGSNSVCTEPRPTPSNPCPECILYTTCTVNEPLVLDLNGDGVRTTGVETPVWFDLDADGVRERLTWTDPSGEEGFLSLDLDANHNIDGGQELFGIGTTLPSGEKASNGFDALAVYDDDADGRITQVDRIWARLLVWIDRNHDGLSQPAELQPIHRHGIEKLSLSYRIDYEPDVNGNFHLFRGTYRSKGTSNTVITRPLEGLAFRRVP
jgi:hypothetical protein